MKSPVSKKPNDVDREIGLKLRKWRLAQEMEACELAEKLGVTYQQLRKYEKGLTRISASRLYEIALTLDVPIHWFFRENGPDMDSMPSAHLAGLHPASQQKAKQAVCKDCGQEQAEL